MTNDPLKLLIILLDDDTSELIVSIYFRWNRVHISKLIAA